VGQRGTVRTWNFTLFFFYGKDNENHQIRIGYFVHQRTISAVKRVEFFSDSVSYIALRGHCLHVMSLYSAGNWSSI
jgi:hypothetical protein